VLFTKYYLGDKMKEDAVGETCNMHIGDNECMDNLIGKPEAIHSVRSCRRKWEKNIKINVVK
jgi:hypothetical protein